MKVYVAGASSEIERCEAFRDACRAIGYTITFDWMGNIRRVGAANAGVSDEQAIACREASDDGVDNADVFVLLLGDGSFGAAQEFGYARGLDAAYATAPHRSYLIVGNHPSVFLRGLPMVATDALAIDWLRGHWEMMHDVYAPTVGA